MKTTKTTTGPVIERDVQGTPDQIGRRLEQAIQAQGYGLLGTIDLREKIRAKGLEFESTCRIYEVCQPVRAKAVLEHDISIATALPCRIALYERAGKMHVATLRPSGILASFGPSGPQDEAQQVEADLEAILDRVARG